jgi:hypothetical protein
MAFITTSFLHRGGIARVRCCSGQGLGLDLVGVIGNGRYWPGW